MADNQSVLRRWHRRIGLLLAAQMFLWLATGFLFNIKYRYGEYLVQLRAATPPPDLSKPLATPAGPLDRLELLFDGVSYVWLGTRGKEIIRWDPWTASKLDNLSAEECQRIAAAAIVGSSQRTAFGEVRPPGSSATAFSARVNAEQPAWQFQTTTGKTLKVIASTGEISHTSDLGNWIDWTYRLHYMQYTPMRWFNIALVTVFLVLSLVLVASGLRIGLG